MVTARVVLSVAAVEVLEALGATGLAQRYRQVLHRRGRKALLLAARLRAELLDELDRLEERHWAQRAHLRRARAVVQPDPLGNLHADRMRALRARVEKAYDGLEALSRDQIEARCLTLTAIAADVSALLAEIEGREANGAFQTEMQPLARRGVGARRPVTNQTHASRPAAPRFKMA